MVSAKCTLAVYLAVLSISYGEAVKADGIDKLVAVTQVHRHGQRSPIFFYPNDPHQGSPDWPVAPGQLTNYGKQQHRELGTFTRERYDGFLPRSFSVDDLYAQTTDVDRTHMSIQCNLAGLYPPQDTQIWSSDIHWQPIPIRVSDEEVISGSPPCSIYSLETANVVTNAKEFVEINEKFADVYAYLSEKTGSNVNSVSGVFSIYDPLWIEDQMGFELPEWTKTVYPSPMDVLTGYYFVAATYTTEQKRLAAGNWLNIILNDFTEKFEKPSSSQKYQLYSAHDFNIGALLNTLGALEPHYPLFASTLYYELRNHSGLPVVNVLYRRNGVLEPITVKGCEFDCPLEQLKTLLADVLADKEAWEKDCAANATSLTDLTTVESDPHLLRELETVLQHANHRRPPHKPAPGIHHRHW